MAKAAKTQQDGRRDKAEFWLGEISKAEDSLKEWHDRGKRVVDRYRDDRTYRTKAKRQFNILWSNVQVLKPALYGRMPKPEVSRRYKDQDPVGRIAATMLERCLEYEIEQYPDFNAAMSGAVEDRLLPGRGVAWIRYEPKINTEEQVSEDVDAQLETLAYECAPCDYVNWQDFLHNPARTWDEVWWVARRVWLSKSEGVERFGEIFATVPIEQKKDRTADKETPKDALSQKAQVWEIWDKTSKSVVWVAKGFPLPLDEKPDPLQLEKFFPCPKPIFATTTTGSLVPVPDYCEYQDQAEELDVITQRIHLLTRALKLRGGYNAEFKELKRLLNETDDNELIPVSSWAAFAEKGGLKGAIDWLPIKDVAIVLEGLFKARQECLQVIYQTVGLSDIIRGSSDPDETLGAQQLKANFGSLRLRSTQTEVATFATELLRLKAEVICGFYSPQTIVTMSGIADTTDGQDQAQVEQAIQLLKSRELRGFRIAIEADTLAQIDETQEKAQAAEFVTSIGGILKEAAPLLAQAPTMAPFIGEVILFAARRMRAGRSVEKALETSLQATMQAISQPKPPDPKQVAAEATAQAKMAQTETERMVAPIKAQAEQTKAVAGVIQAQTDLETAQVQAMTPQVIPMPKKGAV